MRKVQSRLTVSLLFTVLALFAFFGTLFIAGPIDFLYRGVAGLDTARNIAQIVALLAVIALFVTALIFAIPLALQPAKFGRKILNVLPLYFLAFTLFGILSSLIGIGTVGTLFNLQGIGPVSFATAWIALGVVVSAVVVLIAVARMKVSAQILRSATNAMAVTGAISTLGAVAMLVSVVIISASQPVTPNFGGGPSGGRPGQGQRPASTPEVGASGAESTLEAPSGFNAPAGFISPPQAPEATQQIGAQAPASTAEAQGGQRPQSNGQPGQGGGQGRPGQPGQNGGAQPGFPPGGPGGFGNPADLVNRFKVGGGLMIVFAVIGLVSAISGLRALRGLVMVSVTPPNYVREIASAVLSIIAVTVILLGVSQLVPVTRDNPPAQTPIQWDSPQTQDLVTRTCMNCHSNETVWPWYASIAPASWLTTMHVHSARAQFNLSELDSMPTFLRRNLANNMIMQIQAGTMPPKDYLILHPEARLSDAEKQELIAGLQKSLGGQSG